MSFRNELQLPPDINFDISALPVEYVKRRQYQATHDRYKGHILSKTPEDLRVYQQVIWAIQPQVIVELGTNDGGSAMWFADQLRTMTEWTPVEVITVDVVMMQTIPDPDVTFLHGTTVELIDEVHQRVGDRRTMVVEDSAHTYENTLAVLRGYADLVSSGSFFVVEDGIVDEPYKYSQFQGEVQGPIKVFLDEHPEFIGHDLRPYVFGMHHNGWLERR
jgi:cephalosporin hydroxylase